MPFRDSEAGHFLIDVSVNDHEARPFILDTGANVSAIYEPAAKAMDLIAGEGMVSVNGLVGSGLRPRLDGIELTCLLYTSPSPRDKRQSRMPSSA